MEKKEKSINGGAFIKLVGQNSRVWENNVPKNKSEV
jgi:hypothetical protein